VSHAQYLGTGPSHACTIHLLMEPVHIVISRMLKVR
jgi:hypothetical protein